MKTTLSLFISYLRGRIFSANRTLPLISAALIGLMAATAQAANLTWDNGGLSPTNPVDGTTSLWDNSATVWSNGTSDSAWVNGADVAVFGNNNGTAGTVNLGSSVTVGGIIFNPATIGNYTIAPGSGPYTLALSGTTPTVTANANATISAVVTGTTGLTKTGSGTLYLTGVNTYTGGTTINAGILSVNTIYSSGSVSGSLGGTRAVTLNGGTLQYAGAVNFHAMQGGTLTLGVNGGTIDTTATAGSSVYEGVLAYSGSGARTLTLQSESGGTTAGPIFKMSIADGTGGATSLNKTGTGTWVLSPTSANTYTGTTTISAGTLIAGAANVLPKATAVTVESAGTLNLANNGQTIASLTGSGTVTNRITSGGSATLTVGSATYSGTTTFAGQLTQGGAASLSVAIASGSLTLTGASNNYTGMTTISGGRLVLGAAATAQSLTGGFLVNGGTLATSVATATLGSNLTLSSGLVDLNGANVGLLRLASGKNFSMDGGTIELTLGVTYDQIIGLNSATFSITGGALHLNITDVNFAYASSYTIFSGFTSGSVVSGFEIDGYDKVNWAATLGNDGVLTFTAVVPEPESWAMLVFGLCGLLALQRRQRRLAV